MPFRVGKKEGDESLEKLFLEGAAKRGMISLKGHRSVAQPRTSYCSTFTFYHPALTERLRDFFVDMNRSVCLPLQVSGRNACVLVQRCNSGGHCSPCRLHEKFPQRAPVN